MVGRQRSLGVRLSDGAATFVELERFFGRVRVIDFGCVDLAGGEVMHRTISEGETGRDGGGLSSRRSRVEQVVVGLPRQQVVCRFIDLPNVEDDRLAGLLSYEIERHLPFPVEEACYSFEKLSTTGSTARVLVVAAKRTDVEQAVAQVERLGVMPTAVDVLTIAATTAFLSQTPSPPDQTLALIQLEGAEATVDVMCNGILTSSRTVSLVPGVPTVPAMSGERPMEGGNSQGHSLHDERVPIEGYLSFSCDRMIGEGTGTNLSRNGLCVSSNQPVEAGMSLSLSLALPELDGPLEVSLARVQWASRGLFGLEFVIIDQDVRARIQQCLSDYAEWRIRAPSNSAVSIAEKPVGLHAVAAPCQESRSQVEGYVTFSGDGIEGEGTVANVSEHGWRIVSDLPVRTGMVFTLQAALSELNDPVEIVGARVQWTGLGEFGLQIVRDDEAVSAQIAEYIASSHPVQKPVRTSTDRAAALLDELQRVAQSPTGLPGKIFLHGGSKELCRPLHEALQIPVEEWNEFTLGADLAAFGLALRGLGNNAPRLDLLPVDRKVIRRDRTAALLCGLLALVMFLAAGWWGSETVLERRLLAQLEEELVKVKGEAEDVTSLQKEYTVLKTRMHVLEELASAQGRSMNLLKEVVLLLPPDVLLQELSLDGNKLRLRGSTGASAATLISAFEHSALLENAAFTAPISVQGKDRQSFEIAATVRKLPSREPSNVKGKGSS